MGFLDKLFGGSGDDQRPRKIIKAEKKILNMYLQANDRQYFLDVLRQDGSEEAARALLKRFTCSAENHTIDRDEKAMTCDFLVKMGQTAVPPIKEYLLTYETGVNWPFRALKSLLTAEDLVGFLVEVLETIGPQYVREPERKEQLVLTAKEFPEERVTQAVLPYIDDHNETIRFLAVDTLLTHNFEDLVKEALEERFIEEDSQRVLQHLADGFVERGWACANPEAVAEHLPDGYRINDTGKILRR